MIQENWHIEQIEVIDNYNGRTSVVIAVQWVQTFETDTAASVNRGWTQLPLPDDNSPFTEFIDLTQNQVIAWVKNSYTKQLQNYWMADSLRQIVNMAGFAQHDVELLPWEKQQ